MIKGLLFDKDGTLFDFQATWSRWARALLDELAQGNEAARRAMADAVRFDLDAGVFQPDSAVIAGTGAEAAALLAPHAPGLTLEGVEMRLHRAADRLVPVPAVPLVPVLGALRARGLALGVATNDYEDTARRHLGAEAPLFDFIAGFDSGHGPKPQPGMLLAFARHCGLAPGACAMIGDSRHDLAAGRAAGMVTVAVLTGVAKAPDLADLADVVLPDIGHLGDWLDRR